MIINFWPFQRFTLEMFVDSQQIEERADAGLSKRCGVVFGAWGGSAKRYITRRLGPHARRTSPMDREPFPPLLSGAELAGEGSSCMNTKGFSRQ